MGNIMSLTKSASRLAALSAAAILSTGIALAQSGTASIHGHANNQVGQPIKGAVVQLSRTRTGPMKDRIWVYKFPVADNGDFKGEGITPGEYSIDLTADNKDIDFADSVKFVAAENKLYNFDLTRPEFIARLSPEEKAALEEYKKKMGAVLDSNKVVANLNATLQRVRADLAAAAQPKFDDVSKDVADMRDAVAAKPDESILFLTLGDTLQAQGDHLAKQDKLDHKSVMTDEAAMKFYTEALDNYKKSIDLSVASKKPVVSEQAAAYNQIGNTLAKTQKIQDATAAYESAVKLMPANAGVYYGNEAAVLFNASNSGANSLDAAAAAADKAIAADPNQANAYYIKGQALLTKVTLDPKTGKPVAPPGCFEAYQKYLELAPPDSKTAADVREILVGMGQPINTKYKAPGRK